jgi:DNA-binding transcriptional ArsR family regulator
VAANELALSALGDPTRRTIFERLLAGPRTVGELAAGLPVSRPAVSQHLAVLRRAGLVRDTARGTRRVYAVDRGGVERLRAAVDAYWEAALEQFRRAAEEEEVMDSSSQTELVVRKTVRVRRSVEDAFRIFTERIGSWWPLATHSVFGGDATDAVLEPRVGGRFYERGPSGAESEWGRVLSWEAPHRIAFSMYPGRDDSVATRVDVTFSATDDDGTLVVLEHRGWEVHGPEAEKWFRSYDEGWETVLEPFASAADAADPGSSSPARRRA